MKLETQMKGRREEEGGGSVRAIKITLPLLPSVVYSGDQHSETKSLYQHQV